MSDMTTVSSLNYSELLSLDHEEALQHILNSYSNIGLQATQLGRARQIIQDAIYQKKKNRQNKVFLAYTSNLISSGLRETFTTLARERSIDVVISTAGGIEEDIIKCLGNTLVGNFNLDGRQLRQHGINRVGNLLIPNDNYCQFEDFFMPILTRVHAMQRESRWENMTAPSDIIYLIGAELEKKYPNKCQTSLVYWCYRNNIPVFSPALTDGSMGDMIYFYNFSKKGLVVDPVIDVVRLRELGSSKLLKKEDLTNNNNNNNNNNSGKTTCIVLGGGLPKHHLLKYVKAERVVLVTTGISIDACPSSCNIEEDKYNNILSKECEVVRVHGDATFIFPLLLCRTKEEEKEREEESEGEKK